MDEYMMHNISVQCIKYTSYFIFKNYLIWETKYL